MLKTQEVGRRGTPDVLMCINGKFIAWELKTDKGEVDKLQAYNLVKISLAGGFAMVVSPSNFKEALNELKEYIK